ncbi:MAG: hypothetical protein O3A25_10195 [Acidobacteria bacterium]|nr:hypothetical protein [Acidobacteriota bacterium]
MPDDSLRGRGRALEEAYFRKKDQELVEKMRRAATADKARQELSAASGLQDPELVKELEELGFTPETVRLLPFVPLIQVAWAEGDVSTQERKLIVDLARSRGILEGTPADLELARWLATRPSDAMFERATRLVRALLAAGTPSAGVLTGEDLVKYCESIAAASGGVFGIKSISAEERAILEKIAGELQ